MTKVFYYKTRKLYRFALVFLLGTVLVTGCKDDFDGYFDYPSNIEGPIYEQLSSRSNLSEFVKAIDKVPLMKSIINTSGLYTVFAPTNEAIKAYFLTQTRYPGKSGIEDFDVEKKDASGVKTDSILLCQFIEAHIAIDMYFHYDFKRFIPDESANSAEIGGASDRNRYSTRYRDQKYLDTVPGKYVLNNKTNERTPRIYKVRSNSKSVTIYPYKYLRRHSIVNEFAAMYGLKSTPRGEDLYVNGVKVIEADIPAVNGAIHIIDGVIEPKDNLDMMIKRLNPTMWSILQKEEFCKYTPNYDATETEGISKFDTIWNKRYSLGIDIANEYSNNLYTVLLPGKGFEDFVRDSILPAYNIVMDSRGVLKTPMDSIPVEVARALLQQFLVGGTLWETQLKYGFTNESRDTLQTENQTKRPKNLTVTGTLISSNGLVYTLPDNVSNISNVFRTVAKVPMMDRKYKWYLDLATRNAGSTSPFDVIKRHYRKFTVFMPTREAFRTQPCMIYEMKDEYDKIDLYRNGETIYPIVTDSILKNLIIPDVILTPDSLKHFQFRKTFMGGYLQIANNQILFSYNDPTTKVTTDYVSTIPTVARDAANPNGYIRTENGIVYPLDDRVPMPASLTLSGYLSKNRSEAGNNLFYKILFNTKVNSDLIAEDLKVSPVVIADKNDKGNITDPNEKLWGMLISEGNDPQEIYTVFYPTDAALKAYAKACNVKTTILPNAYDGGDPYWAKIARQLIIKTRVYSDGTRVQNFYDIYSNPVEGKDNLFQTLNYKKIVKVTDYFNDNEYTNLNLSFENGTITLTDPISGRTAKTTSVKNVECVNGVFHEIDDIPFPVMTTKAEWDNFISRPIPAE
ncbi:MAG: fasciclin domain-containing protein [Bacteroidales bacterium]|nr:fasciclin domain-containing protein [Bacteroidales bacterium]